MPFLNSILSLSLLPTATLSSSLALHPRAIGDVCRGTLAPGTCQPTSLCRGISHPQPFCPHDPDDVQCCVEIPCRVGDRTGFCRSISDNGCPGGTFDPGNYCPGPQDIQCCLKPGSGVGGNTDVEVGRNVLAKAMEAAGVPYAWGGGSCSGPTRDLPGPNGEPWNHGEVGFDCSGLVCWAVCQVTGRNLFAEGLRNTAAMYCAAESRLLYKKYPLAERKKGDAVFFGGNCSCSDWDSIHHVGLVMEDGSDRVWNAPNDEINAVVEMRLGDFSETPCPYVVRFTG